MYDNNPTLLLNLRRLPARLDYAGAGALLHFDPVAVKGLVTIGMLKPLGNPQGQEHKYFSTKVILRLADDEKWLHDATRAVIKLWAEKNKKRNPDRTECEGRPVGRPKRK